MSTVSDFSAYSLSLSFRLANNPFLSYSNLQLALIFPSSICLNLRNNVLFKDAIRLFEISVYFCWGVLNVLKVPERAFEEFVKRNSWCHYLRSSFLRERWYIFQKFTAEKIFQLIKNYAEWFCHSKVLSRIGYVPLSLVATSLLIQANITKWETVRILKMVKWGKMRKLEMRFPSYFDDLSRTIFTLFSV